MVDTTPFIVLAPGFSNYKRKYPTYEKRYGKENFAYATNAKRVTIEDHLDEMESLIPKNRSYILVGYSMGGSNILELLSRKPLENCKGITLVGSSRIITTHWFLNFLFKTPVPVMYFLAILVALFFPINLIVSGFNLKKAIPASFEGLYRFVENGARDMKKEYNHCVRKVGRNVKDILKENKDIPLLIIRIQKDMMVDEEDLATVRTFFNKSKERMLPANIIHLTHKYDDVYIDIIEEEMGFFGIK